MPNTVYSGSNSNKVMLFTIKEDGIIRNFLEKEHLILLILKVQESNI
jgi:hypothetical protein